MRHNVYGRHLNRDKDERNSLFRSLIRNLILHRSLETSESKAKAIKGLVDKLITAGKSESNASRRNVQSLLASKDIEKKFLEEIVPQYKNRTSGFTQVVKLGRRAGDGTMMVKMSLVEEKSKTSSKEEVKENKAEEKKEAKKRVSKKKEEK